MPCFTAMRAEIALMSGSAFAVTHHAFSSGAGRTSDGNGSHASTLKSPSYTKSVSWQHYRGLDTCDGGSNGIPSPTTTRYVSAMSVAKGVVSLTGQESLNGLSVVMTPGWDNANGVTGWARNCNIQSDSALQQACEDVFRFDDAN
ncbi:transposase domain protein [Shigella boydii 4444-74]|uniref:Transposase domain protein n=1 Tax=Shigella boydii 4444-74 TaxID=766140 RepID=I6EWA3_SHIBO|nr:transposase domain protein [Shigella boydii 4444-74]